MEDNIYPSTKEVSDLSPISHPSSSMVENNVFLQKEQGSGNEAQV